MIQLISHSIYLIRRMHQRKKTQKGFSIPELIIVVAIFAIVTTIAMFDQGRLSSNVLLTNMTYEVGLAIREAQVYGLGVRNTGAIDDSKFLGEYGAHFDIHNSKEIYLFGNNYAVSENPAYDPGEELFQYQFENQRGNKIVALCVGDINPSNGERCTDDPNNKYRVEWVDIIFKRPNPAPSIYANNGSGSSRVVGRVYVIVNNIDNSSCRAVVVEGTGQIRVEDSNKLNPVCVNKTE